MVNGQFEKLDGQWPLPLNHLSTCPLTIPILDKKTCFHLGRCQRVGRCAVAAAVAGHFRTFKVTRTKLRSATSQP